MLSWSAGRSRWRRSGPTTPATVNGCRRELRKWGEQKALGLGHNPVSKASLRGQMAGAAWYRRNASRQVQVGWVMRRPGGG